MEIKLKNALQELSQKDDRHIHNIVTKEWGAYKYQEAAKIIYKERKLDSEEKQELIQNYQHYLEEALLKLDLGLSIEETEQYLVNMGMEPDHAALHVIDLQKKKENKSSNRAKKIFVVLLILFLLRMVYRYIY